MARVMMGLGDYRFSIDTAAYQQLQRATEYRWPSQDRIGRDPALQFVGRGPDTIKLSGNIFPQFRGGLGQIDTMRAEADKGSGLMLVDGRGRVWGRYSIVRIEETQSVFFDDGVSRKIEFKLELSRYGDDAGAGSTQADSIVQGILERNADVSGAGAQAEPPAAVDMSGLMAQSRTAATEPLPDMVSSGLGDFEGSGLSVEGAMLSKSAGLDGLLAKGATDALVEAGVSAGDAAAVTEAVSSVAVRAAQGHGIAALGTPPVTQALSGFADKTGLDPLAAALERVPGNTVDVASGLYDLGVNAADYAETFARDPSGSILGVAKRLKALDPTEVFRVAGSLSPGRGGEVLAQVSRDYDRFESAFGTAPEEWPDSEPDPTLVARAGSDR